jgi:hypothetical protein
MTGHKGSQRPWRRHPAEKLANQLTSAFTEYFDWLTDEELLAIDIVRVALRRIADEAVIR